MQFITRTKVLVGLGAAAAALAMTVPTAASAAPVSAPTTGMTSLSASTTVKRPPCPAGGTLCTWQNSGYRGHRWAFSYNSHPHALWFYVGNAANDQISSFFNDRAWTSYFSMNCPASGPVGFAHGGGANPNLNTGNGEWNDSISAVALGTNNGLHTPGHWHHRGGC